MEGTNSDDEVENEVLTKNKSAKPNQNDAHVNKQQMDKKYNRDNVTIDMEDQHNINVIVIDTFERLFSEIHEECLCAGKLCKNRITH